MARRTRLVRLPSELRALVDERAVRAREAAIDEALVEGYRRVPPRPADPWAEAAAESLVRERW